MFNKLTRTKRAALALSAGSVAATANVAFAADTTTNTAVKNIINVIVNIFMYIGIILLAWSVGMLILAFKNEDADSKSKAIMLLVVSVALIGIKLTLGSVINGLVSGVSI